MNEKRYSIRVAAECLNATPSFVQYRARRLRIDTRYGLTAEDVIRIRDFERSACGRKCYETTVDDLKKEIEEHE